MDEPRGISTHDGMVRHGPEIHAERAGTLLFIQHLRDHQQRISEQLQRVSHRLLSVMNNDADDLAELRQTAQELERLLEQVYTLIKTREAQELRRRRDPKPSEPA